MQFVIIAEHGPELCPMSNAKIRDLMKQMVGNMPNLAEKLGINVITTSVFGPDHVIHTVAEADNIEAIREFVMQSRLAQWNTTRIHATWPMEEAMSKAEELPTVF
jgi:hypothetical protein